MERKMNVWKGAAATAVLTALLLLTGCPNHAAVGRLFPNGSVQGQGEAAIVTLQDKDLDIEGTVLKRYEGSYPDHVKLVLKVPAHITEIADKAFYYCEGLTSVDLSGCTALQTIGKEAFRSLTNLTSVNLSGCTGLQTIGKNAFYYCKGLTSVDLSGCTRLGTIGHRAFSGGCTNAEIQLPASVIEIADNAFGVSSACCKKVIVPNTEVKNLVIGSAYPASRVEVRP